MALDVLHYHERIAVRQSPRIQNADDAGMVEPDQGLFLMQEFADDVSVFEGRFL